MDIPSKHFLFKNFIYRYDIRHNIFFKKWPTFRDREWLYSNLIFFLINFRRNLHNLSVSTVPKPWFNFAGFAQPEVVINLLNGNDYDGFNDRQFFVCPTDRDVDFDELVPVPAELPNFSDLFRVIMGAREQFDGIYTCDEDATTRFKAFHNNANKRKRETLRRDSDRRSIVLKSKGQVLRLSAVIFALDQALSRLSVDADDNDSDVEDTPETEDTEDEEKWSAIISGEHMRVAIDLMEHLIDQKFALGKPSSSDTAAVAVAASAEGAALSITDRHEVKRLQRMLECPNPITATALSLAHISSSKVQANGKTYDAPYLMTRGQEEKFGKIEKEECNRGANKTMKMVFRKHAIENLSEEKKEQLKAMKVNMSKFVL